MLLNIRPLDTAVYRDDLHDSSDNHNHNGSNRNRNILLKHPGAGAYSYHGGEHWEVTRDMACGEELFNDYAER